MSVTINGTSGVTTPGINNSEGYTGDGLSIAAGAPAGALQIDTSGNLGLGVTPSAWESSYRIVQLSSSGAAVGGRTTTTASLLTSNAFRNASGTWVYFGSAPAARFEILDGAYQFYTAPSGTAGNPITFTQAMTLDASGNLLVGTTSTSSLNANCSVWSTSNGNYAVCHANGSTSGANYIGFLYNGSGIGSITQNGTTGILYNTSSDYRLKENVAPLTNALDTIAALKPCTFTWKADGSADRGFIAHELQEVIPQAVSGEKDAVDDKGNIRPQGVDYGKITPELVAAIQEQQAMITELKARIEQLEAK